MNLRQAAEMALEALETLWDILDDIDTASDMAKENDAWYRKRVEALQKKRWDTMITTDGYKLKGGPVEALRQALAQPEQEQKTPLKVLNLTVFTENRLRNGRVYDVETLQAMTNRDILAIPDMGKKALKEVMEALDVYAVNISQERVDETAKGEHEPWTSVQCVCGGTIYFKYTPPISDYHEGWEEGFKAAKREWVGLTDEEIIKCFDRVAFGQVEDDLIINKHVNIFTAIRGIESILKEKNGG